MTTAHPPFHLAFPVKDLGSTRLFYVEMLGCGVGRESDTWIDFDFFGHQITAHLSGPVHTEATNAVDGDQVPVRHFGVILDMDRWQALAKSLRNGDTQFVIEPHIRFAGEVGEQATMFFMTPAATLWNSRLLQTLPEYLPDKTDAYVTIFRDGPDGKATEV